MPPPQHAQDALNLNRPKKKRNIIIIRGPRRERERDRKNNIKIKNGTAFFNCYRGFVTNLENAISHTHIHLEVNISINIKLVLFHYFLYVYIYSFRGPHNLRRPYPGE